MKPRCADCKFYDAEQKDCHRFPPQQVSSTDSSYSHDSDYQNIGTSIYERFPDVEEDDWCGEFRKK